MPKGVTKEKQELVSGKGCFPFLLEREDTQKKLSICTKLLESLMKTRSNNKVRRDKYKNDLTNCLKKLCIHSTDLLETRKKLEETKEDLSRQSRQRCELQDRLLEVEYENRESSQYKERFEEQRELKHKSEQNYAELLRENDSLKERLKELKNKKKDFKTVEDNAHAHKNMMGKEK